MLFVVVTLPGEGGLNVGDYKLRLDFRPFNHKPPTTVLKRQGVPFWDYLDAKKIPTTFYDLPSNYPPSPSQYGHHRCLCGMGTPDMLGTPGIYQHYSEGCPAEGVDVGVTRVIHFRKFEPGAAGLSQLEYLLFGKANELFLAHSITKPPDFDQVLFTHRTKVRVVPQQVR